MLLTNKRGEERNYGVLIAAIVAIVAIVGLIILFNKGGAQGAAIDKSDMDAYQEGLALSSDAGARCGQCTADYANSGMWDSAKCPRQPDLSVVSGKSPSHLVQSCCKNECNAIGVARCMEYCRGAADEAGYGYAHGTSSYLGGE